MGAEGPNIEFPKIASAFLFSVCIVFLVLTVESRASRSLALKAYNVLHTCIKVLVRMLMMALWVRGWVNAMHTFAVAIWSVLAAAATIAFPVPEGLFLLPPIVVAGVRRTNRAAPKSNLE